MACFFLWLCARPVGRARFRCFILAILRDLVWYVSWVCAYVGLEGGSVIFGSRFNSISFVVA